MANGRIGAMLFVLMLKYGFVAYAQSDSIKAKIIDGVSQDFLRIYISYDKGKEVASFIRHKFNTGGYDSSLNINEFAYELTKDIRQITKDEHISIWAWPNKRVHHFKVAQGFYSKRHLYYFNSKGEMKYKFWYKMILYFWEKKKERRLEKELKDNFAYGEIKILPGNIGYLELDNFLGASRNHRTAKGRIPFKTVMKFLRHTNSIIIDLRKNTGGYIRLSDYFASFFSQKNGTYFISTSYKIRYDTIPNDHDTTINEEHLLPKKNNSRFSKGKEIYILTSHSTFSAAELFCYALKKYGRAKIIGEHTRGGGNGHFGALGREYYAAIVPEIKVYDKESNFTIEQNGIEPDIHTTEDSALIIAYADAQKKAGKDLSKTSTRYFRKSIRERYFYNHGCDKFFPDYVGKYQPAKIFMADKRLWIEYDNQPKQMLIPISKDHFSSKYFRGVLFNRNQNNRIVSITIKRPSGYMENYRLNN